MIFISPPSVPLAIRPEPTHEQIEAWCAVLWHWQKTYHPQAPGTTPLGGRYLGWYTRAEKVARQKKVHESRGVLQFHCKLPHDIVTASFALIFPDNADYIPY